MKRIACLIFVICCLQSAAHPRVPPEDIVKPEKLPAFGRWMLDRDLAPASWLGQKYQGKTMREPINVIVIDRFADSDYKAKERLFGACARAGYRSRTGHSGGYRAYIAGRIFRSLTEDDGHAFANGPFELNNNHGRLFGPYQERGKYYFVGAFSREIVNPFKKVKHQYGSFNKARDDFGSKMDKRTNYRIIGYANMNSKLINDAELTTGDHDGSAVILNAAE